MVHKGIVWQSKRQKIDLQQFSGFSGGGGGGAAAGGMKFEGGDTTERTTISTTTVDLSTVTVSLATALPFIVQLNFRKTAGAAANVSLGLKLNTTQIIANTICSASNNVAGDGILIFSLNDRETNYLQAQRGTSSFFDGTTARTDQFVSSANAPSVTITSVIITGLVGSASITLAIKNVRVWSYPTS